MNRGIVVAVVGIGMALPLLLWQPMPTQTRPYASTEQWSSNHAYTLTRMQTGVLWHDGFLENPHTLQSPYTFNGSAPPDQRTLSWKPGMLGLAVTPHGRNQHFIGFFAVTNANFPSGALVQVQMIPYPIALHGTQTAEVLVAVQTANTGQTGDLNYIYASYVQESTVVPRIALGVAHGYIRDAVKRQLYAVQQPRLLQTIRHATLTVQTTGSHVLRLWLGKKLLYDSTRLSLGIQSPFQVYLEVQAQGIPYTGFFHQLAIYRTQDVQLEGLPMGADVTLFEGHGKIVTSTVAEGGGVSLQLPINTLHVRGRLKIHDGSQNIIFNSVSLTGGDIFRLSHPLLAHAYP